ncbi:MAG: GTPase domain-containing protein [Deltaproteobacteria bacterium]|nr:GTPase domain-containing protein [Deltaproteobacteria bacterium]
MALFNYATRELSAKIVYYGPGLSGKTTNIEMVHRILRADQKGRLISLPTETDRTLFFDFLPVDLGQIRGFKVRFHLYTVPGQVFYNATRRLVLQGVDGVVFVADSQVEMAQSNEESLKNLVENLAGYGKKLEEIPFVMQYNKRDLRNVSSVQEMSARLNTMNAPVFEGIAKDGVGVSETLVAVSRLVFSHLRKTLLLPAETAEREDAGRRDEAKVEKPVPPVEEPLEEISDLEEIQEIAGKPEAGEAQEGIGVQEPQPAQEEIGEEPAIAEVAESAPEEFGILPGAPPVVEEAAVVEEAPPAGKGLSSDLEEIEIDIPERAPEAASAKEMVAGISVEPEGGLLTFLKFETPYLSPEGHAVIPAVFMTDEGNIVRMRIRVTVEERP